VKKIEFLPRIESMRGIAALTVVGYHVHLPSSSAANWLDNLIYQGFLALMNGTGAVVAFFVISGFVLARSLDAKEQNTVRFFRNRIFRLFPAGMAVVLLLTALHYQFGFYVGYEGDFSPANVLLNMLLIKSDINGVMWSMTVECAATPLILLSVWLFRKYGRRSLWGLVAILFGLSFWGSYVHLFGGFTNLAPLYAFVVGVLIHFGGDRIPARIAPGLAVVTCVAAIAIYGLCGTHNQSALVLMLECLSAATLITLIAYRRDMKFFQPLDFAIIRFYGRISYSFYLLHMIGIGVAGYIIGMESFSLSDLPISVAAIYLTALSVLMTTPAAYLSWRFIEIPFINFSKNAKCLGNADLPVAT
jgi:exopolysaccharide production protein ExoZ